MNSVYLGISVVFPLVCYMIIGRVVKLKGLVGERTLSELNSLIFRVLLFTLIFLNSYTVDIKSILSSENIKILILALSSLTIIFIGAIIIVRFFVTDKQRHVVIVQAIYRSNLALFGLPIILSLYGEGRQSSTAILIAVVVPLYNISAVFLLGSATEKGFANGKKVSGKLFDKNENARNGRSGIVIKTILKAFKNPLVVGSLLGLLVNAICTFFNISIPQLIKTPMDAIGKCATPLAFMVLGGSLEFSKMKKNLKVILSVTIIRLVIIPAIVMGAAIVLGLRNEGLVAFIGVFASPVAVSSYTMAKDLEVAPELAGELVAVTTIVSLFSMFGFISVLNYFHFI
jgi:Predicted permeases